MSFLRGNIYITSYMNKVCLYVQPAEMHRVANYGLVCSSKIQIVMVYNFTLDMNIHRYIKACQIF